MSNPYEADCRQCILCKNKIVVDYKNPRLLSQFVSPFTGKIYESNITGKNLANRLISLHNANISFRDLQKAAEVGWMWNKTFSNCRIHASNDEKSWIHERSKDLWSQQPAKTTSILVDRNGQQYNCTSYNKIWNPLLVTFLYLGYVGVVRLDLSRYLIVHLGSYLKIN